MHATVLRTLAYGDTSVIAKFFTAEFGVVTVMARGVRGRKKRGGVPQLFSSGVLTVQVREHRDMHPLRDFTAERVRLGLSGSLPRLAGAALLADLVLRHSGTESQDVVANLLNVGLDVLERVAADQVPVAVLARGWGLVDALGYRPNLIECVGCGRPFTPEELGRFDFGRGGVACGSCLATGPRVGPIARAELRSLIEAGGRSAESSGVRGGSSSTVTTSVALPEVARAVPHIKLLADFAGYHVADGRRLEAFDYFLSTLNTGEDS